MQKLTSLFHFFLEMNTRSFKEAYNSKENPVEMRTLLFALFLIGALNSQSQNCDKQHVPRFSVPPIATSPTQASDCYLLEFSRHPASNFLAHDAVRRPEWSRRGASGERSMLSQVGGAPVFSNSATRRG
jgi:hypothetical protein